jgi:glycerate-2-kinase
VRFRARALRRAAAALRSARARQWGSVKPGDPRLLGRVHIIAAAGACWQRRRCGRKQGVRGCPIGPRGGRGGEVGRRQTRAPDRYVGRAVPPPCLLLSGGETTVTVGGDGCGAATSSSCSGSA